MKGHRAERIRPLLSRETAVWPVSGLIGAGIVACASVLAPKAAFLGLAFVAGLLVLLYLVRRPDVTFLAAVFALPITAFGVLDVGATITLSKALFFLLAVQTLVIALQKGIRWAFQISRADVYLLLFLGAVVFVYPIGLIRIGALEAARVEDVLRGPYVRSMGQVANLALMVAVYFMTRDMIRQPGMDRRVARVLVVSLAVVSLYGLYQFVGAPRSWPLAFVSQARDELAYARGFWGIARVSSTGQEPREFSYSILPTIVLLVSFRVLGVRPWAVGRRWSVLLAVSLLCFLLTFSRSGWIFLLISVALMLPVLGRRSWKRAVRLVAVFVAVWLVLGSLVALGLTGTDLVAVVGFQMKGLEESWRGSVEYPKIRVALDLATAHPWFGVGFGNYNFHFKDQLAGGRFSEGRSTLEREVIATPHIQLLALLAEVGVVGTVLFVLFLVACFREAWRGLQSLSGPEARGLGQAFFAGAAAMVVVHTYTTWVSLPYLWFWLGAMHGLSGRNRPEPGHL